MRFRILFIVIFVLLLLAIPFLLRKQNKELKDGMWRGEFVVQNEKVPFVFEVKDSGTDSTKVYLINAMERVPLTGITYIEDTVCIPIDIYNSELVGIVKGNKIEGLFHRSYLEGDGGIPFIAVWGDSVRFKNSGSATSVPIDGKWNITFISSQDTTESRALFKLENDILIASVMSDIGDLRYMEGILTKAGFKLSTFNGLNPYLIDGTFDGENYFTGNFYTTSGVTQLIGQRATPENSPDPYNVIYMEDGYDKINFSYPNPEGRWVSLHDERYRGKVVIVNLMGSWCPHCLDEIAYLAPWYEQNKDRGIEVIALAFERTDDRQEAQAALSRLIRRYEIGFEVLFAGKIEGNSEISSIKGLSPIITYPVTIFIDKDGEVRRVYTGFNGPSTGLFYEEYKQEFNKIVDILINEY